MNIRMYIWMGFTSSATGAEKSRTFRYWWRLLKSHGLCGTRLFVGDRCLGLVEALGETFPAAKCKRRTVHFYRNMFSVTPRSKMREVAAMLKAIHAQESKEAARETAKAVVARLREMKLREAADKLEKGIEETLTHMGFPPELGGAFARRTAWSGWGRSRMATRR